MLWGTHLHNLSPPFDSSQILPFFSAQTSINPGVSSLTIKPSDIPWPMFITPTLSFTSSFPQAYPTSWLCLKLSIP